MKVLVIADALANKSPGSRFRIEQWMTWMARDGVQSDYAAFEDEGLRQVIYTPGKYLQKATGVLRGYARRVALLRKVLRKLAQTRRFELQVIGAGPFALDGVSVTAQAWRADSEVADLQRFDIGIMPLPDDPWVSRRTHLKVRQYMGLGIPCVVSPLGVNRELIQDGVNGFLASTEEEWLAKITRLLDDPALRERIGAAGRKTIEDGYSAAPWAPRVLDILRTAAGTRHARG